MLFNKKIKVNDLVKINSNCENTRKPVYKVYAIVENKKGTFYVLENTYCNKLHDHLFEREELIKL